MSAPQYDKKTINYDSSRSSSDYVSSSILDSGWSGRFSTNNVFLVREGNSYIGVDQGSYRCFTYPKKSVAVTRNLVAPALKAEFDAWDAASDEAIENIEC